MVVTIEQIRDEGLKLDEQVPVEQLQDALAGTDSGKDTGFRVRAPSMLHATFRKVSGGVLLTGKLTAHIVAPCKRCLTDVNLDLPVSFTLNLIPQKAMVARDDEAEETGDGGEQEGSFDLEDADQEAFDGKTIDLDPIVREQVLLALPMDAVCREDCKGLCPQCGINRNEKQCSCEEKRVDPRFAALKDIKLN